MTLALPGGEPVSALGLGTWRMGEDRATHGAELAALRSKDDIHEWMNNATNRKLR
jgi:diketogulonate reductase-like aldo/keto reductase